MAMITLDLPEHVVQQAQQAASALRRPVEEIMSDIIKASLLPVDDVPSHLQAEMTEMSWLATSELWQIANSTMSESEQVEMRDLSQQQGNSSFSGLDMTRLEVLREEYGRIMLRKAHAYALLSLRGGTPLLSNI